MPLAVVHNTDGLDKYCCKSAGLSSEIKQFSSLFDKGSREALVGGYFLQEQKRTEWNRIE